MTYDAFICYCPADIAAARQLCRSLQRYRIPKGLRKKRAAERQSLSIFLPEPGDGKLSTNDRSALETSAFVVVVCSPRSAQDARVDEEIRAFKRLGHPEKILTLILDGEPNAADGKKGFGADDECFADALKYGVDTGGELDRSRRFEPIAADARPQGDGSRAVVLKIAAGLLGVGFDDLYQREQRRQMRRVRIIVAASLVLTTLLAVLTVKAFLSGRESRRQLESTREVNGYVESLFANVDRPALQKMNPKLMSLILDASEQKLDKGEPRPSADLEAQMRQILGQAYLACGLWDKAIVNLQRSLVLGKPIFGPGDSFTLIGQRDLGEALIGAGKFAEAKELLSQVPPASTPVVRYQLARALALTGDLNGAQQLLAEEIKARPGALAQALQDPSFASIHSTLAPPPNH